MTSIRQNAIGESNSFQFTFHLKDNINFTISPKSEYASLTAFGFIIVHKKSQFIYFFTFSNSVLMFSGKIKKER